MMEQYGRKQEKKLSRKASKVTEPWKHEVKLEVKLDFNPTVSPQSGFRAVQIDVNKFPWEFKKESVDEVWYHFGFQRVPGRLRGKFMEELYRILKPSGKATFVTPYYSSMRSIMDYSYEWPPICEMSYLYFNKGWREQNKAPELACDFDFGYGYVLDPEAQTKAQEVQSFWVKHYVNSVFDLQVVLTKRP